MNDHASQIERALSGLTEPACRASIHWMTRRLLETARYSELLDESAPTHHLVAALEGVLKGGAPRPLADEDLEAIYQHFDDSHSGEYLAWAENLVGAVVAADHHFRSSSLTSALSLSRHLRRLAASSEDLDDEISEAEILGRECQEQTSAFRRISDGGSPEVTVVGR